MNPLITAIGLAVTAIGLAWDKITDDKKPLTPEPEPAALAPEAQATDVPTLTDAVVETTKPAEDSTNEPIP